MNEEDFEKLRDEIELKVKQAIRNWRLCEGLSDPSVFSLKDLGIKARAEVYNGYDRGATNFEIQKAIDKVASHQRETRKEREATKFLGRMMSMGYYGYVKLARLLGIPKETLTVRTWYGLDLPRLPSLVNPGGKITVREGIYDISDSVVHKPKTTLCGVGKTLTRLRLADGVDKTVLATTEELHWMSPVIKDLTVDGNKANNKVGHGIDIFGSMHGVAEHIEIADCVEDGMRLRGTLERMCLGLRMSDVNIEGCGGASIRMLPWSFDLMAVNCNFGRSGDHQLELGHASQIVTSHIWEGSKCGVVVYERSRVGIGPLCIIEGNGEHGIWLYNTTHCRVIGDQIQDNAKVVDDSSAIALLGASLHNLVVGNMCRDTRTPRRQRGVSEGDKSDWNLIVANDVSESKVPLSKVGANTEVGKNLGYITENATFSDPFPIDSTGIKMVTIPHYLNLPPSTANCAVWIIEVTAVEDWAYGFVKVYGADAANVYVKVNVTVASATSGATARVGVIVIKPR